MTESGIDLEPAGQTRDGGQVLAVSGPIDDGAVREILRDIRMLDGVLYADLAPAPFDWENQSITICKPL